MLRKLNGDNYLIVMDWAMKLLPLQYREQMRDFLSCILSLQQNVELKNYLSSRSSRRELMKKTKPYLITQKEKEDENDREKQAPKLMKKLAMTQIKMAT